jgi:E3 ubiquitin-protein ligase CCNP1IP1
MDFTLRCNSLKCRVPLGDRAVVTTCSHIFCLACAAESSLSRLSNIQRICPACETSLVNSDDAVETSLNPTEDYKTSVLSGLNPSAIMECAGRGLAFYSYQATQEMFELTKMINQCNLASTDLLISIYQEFTSKSHDERYNSLSTQLDQTINEANSEITNLRSRVNGA